MWQFKEPKVKSLKNSQISTQLLWGFTIKKTSKITRQLPSSFIIWKNTKSLYPNALKDRKIFLEWLNWIINLYFKVFNPLICWLLKKINLILNEKELKNPRYDLESLQETWNFHCFCCSVQKKMAGISARWMRYVVKREEDVVKCGMREEDAIRA